MIRAAKNLIALGAGVTGVTAHLRRRARRGGVHAFGYHRVGDAGGPFFPGFPAEEFDRQCAFLARHYEVVPLVELGERLRAGDPVGHLASISFDDGYRDNLEVALPILERHGLPATIFLPTRAIDTGEPLWHDRVALIFERTRCDRVVLEVGGREHAFDLPDTRARLTAMTGALRALKTVRETEVDGAVESLRSAAGVADYRPLWRDMLDWDDVRAMIPRGIDFGAHSVHHSILAHLSTDEVRREVTESKRRIEDETGEACRVFAYPNGEPGVDFTPEIEAMVAEAGFTCAGSRGFDANPRGGNPYNILRWTPEGYTLPYLALRMAWFARR
jgi:peptidoglycan/xylan/chitin deacetylase (PgdA/CDA1 family)